MNTPAIQLAALDLDGTLLDRTSRITPRTLDAIGQAVRRGVVVLPATGRGLSALPRVAAVLPGVRYAITSNGAAVWDMGDDPAAAIRSCYGDPGPEPVKQPVCLHYSPLAPATARAVYDLLGALPGGTELFCARTHLQDPRGHGLEQGPDGPAALHRGQAGG